jgi:hypothetical protein
MMAKIDYKAPRLVTDVLRSVRPGQFFVTLTDRIGVPGTIYLAEWYDEPREAYSFVDISAGNKTWSGNAESTLLDLPVRVLAKGEKFTVTV